MEFRILGPLEVGENGRLLEVRGKPRALLGMLLVHANEVVSADRLIDALWGERPPATAQTALHVHVSQLRKLLGAERIETRAPGYRLVVAPEELDSARFERLLDELRPDEALALWRGRPLAEFEYEPWALAEAARLEELRAAAEEDRLERALASGVAVVPELEALVRAQPLRERPRALLMRALYLAGRQADALAVYQDARQTLVQEVGIEPGPELQDLYKRILNQDPALARPSPAQQPAEGRREERKVVTVLFCDLVGFTSRSEVSDPEDMSALLSRFHIRLRAELERFGGTVEKFVGDAVMALFGAPVAHEDDAERALRAALSIRDWIAEAEDDLQVRIGISTGVALVRLGASPAEGEAMAVGDVVNTASRLQHVAPQGAILVGEATYRATRRAIAYERVDPVEVKGKAEPVAIWVAKDVRDAAADGERPTTPLVGRERELTLLQQTYERARVSRAPQLVTLVGEPGIGKTRLLTEFRALVEGGDVAVRHGRCLAYGDGITFWALGQIVKEHAGILESDTGDVAAEKLAATVEPLAAEKDRQWLFARLAPLVGATAETSAEQEESFAAWSSFLEAIAACQPLVLLIEDLHWADDALLEFVAGLVEWVTDVPLLVVATARPELFERAPDWSGGKRNAATVALDALTDIETAAVVAELLPGTVLASDTQALLIERAGGNPLYAEEFVRLVVDRGADDVAVPEGVHAVIAARLDTLSPERKQLVHAAAVVGKVFWAGALAAMTRDSKESVLASLHELGRKELIRRVRASSIADDVEYLFWHVLVRDVAYEQIPRAERARLHVAAAVWIERIAGERVTDHAEFLAHHYRTALELAEAGGTADGQLRERAATFSVAAGDRTLQLDSRRAARYYGEAVELLAPDDPRRGKVIVAAADAALKGGSSIAEVEGKLQGAIAELRSRGDEIAAADLLRELSFARVFTAASPADRLAPIEEARAILERYPPTRELGLVYDQLLLYYGQTRDDEAVLRLAPRTVELLEQFGLRDELVLTRSRVAISRAAYGDETALDESEALERLVRDPGAEYSSYAIGTVLNNCVCVRELAGGSLKSMSDVLENAIAIAGHRGLYSPATWGKANSLAALYALGEWDQLLARADEIAWTETAFPTAWLVGVSSLMRVLAARGEVQKAIELSYRSLPQAREYGDVASSVLAAAAFVSASAGDLVTTTEYLRELGSRPPDLDSLSPEIARLCASAGRLDVLRSILGVLDVRAPFFVPCVAHADGVLAEAEGSLARAETAYLDAASTWRERDYVVDEARALVDIARCRIALGRDAKEPLRQARATFERLGARTFLREIDALEPVRA